MAHSSTTQLVKRPRDDTCNDPPVDLGSDKKSTAHSSATEQAKRPRDDTRNDPPVIHADTYHGPIHGSVVGARDSIIYLHVHADGKGKAEYDRPERFRSLDVRHGKFFYEGPEFRLGPAEITSSGRVTAVLSMKYKSMKTSEFSKKAEKFFDISGDHIAQIVGKTEDRRLYFHGSPGIQPSMSVAEKISREDAATFLIKWQSMIQTIESQAADYDVRIDWTAAEPDWFWHDGKDWTLIHWKEQRTDQDRVMLVKEKSIVLVQEVFAGDLFLQFFVLFGPQRPPPRDLLLFGPGVDLFALGCALLSSHYLLLQILANPPHSSLVDGGSRIEELVDNDEDKDGDEPRGTYED